MRVHNGNEINEDFLNKLKEFWKKNSAGISGSYEQFVIRNTGWTHEEFVAWVANGRIP